MHYLDNAATAPVLPVAAQAACRMMCEDFGNPSSQHKMGVQAERLLTAARAQAARAMGARPGEVIFTSGGTESINTAIRGACRRGRRYGKHIVTTGAEHAAALHTVRALESEGFEVTVLPPDGEGRVSAAAVADALREDTILLTTMLVNNETGCRFPVEDMGRALKKRCPNALFHVDAVQGLFRVPLTPVQWACDLMSVSGHKIGAPKGVGALYIAQGVKIAPLLYGGGQEQNMRPGTENLPGIAAFGEACRLRAARMEEDAAHVQRLHDRLMEGVRETLPFAVQNGKNDVPHVVNLSFPGCKSEVMLRLLEMEEVYVSAGSACSRGHASHVLHAMGLDGKRIDCALRISLGPQNTTDDIDAFLAAAAAGAARLRR